MNTRYLEDEDLDSAPRDREISLGATTILGIFLLLALVCAVFFGFGYTMGRRSSLATAPAASDMSEATTLKTTGAAKPTPGSAPAARPSSDPDTSGSEDTASSSAPQLPQPAEAPAAELRDQPVTQKSQPAVASTVKPAAYAPPSTSTITKAPPAAAAVHPAATSAPAGPPALVQVAAVSHQEDADTLLNALKRRGYDVTVRHEPQDKLLHIQLGPFSNRKDADAMRQRLLADGYNAIVK